MNCDAPNVVTNKLDLSGVQSRPDFNPEISNSIANFTGATDRPGRPIENSDK